ncbi:MAG TPA: phage holin family protein [Herbaspirillum sp.]|jgi:uncharacterized membrane protein YqjE
MPESFDAETAPIARTAPPGRTARTESAPPPHLLGSLTAIGKNVLGLVFNRMELAACELSEVRVQLMKLIVIGSLALMAAGFAVAYWSVLVVLVNWDTLGWRILAIVAGFFTMVAAGLAFAVRSLLQDKLAMPETLGELRKDRDALLS